MNRRDFGFRRSPLPNSSSIPVAVNSSRHLSHRAMSAVLANDAVESFISTQEITGSVAINAIIERNFDGKRYLYDCFRRSFMEEFRFDLIALRKAIGRNDMTNVMRLSHALKSALYMLGYECESSSARAIELAARALDSGAVHSRWRELRLQLRPILTSGTI